MSKGEDFNRFGVRLRKGFYILFKIALSFKSTAIFVLWLKFLQIIFIPVDLLFQLLENLFYKKKLNSNIPIIFVVGIQRTGSTLVSQFIEKTFPFAPIGNFNSIFKKSSFYIHSLLSKLYKKPNRSYQNFYGISKGFFSIGDCYELWDRWFGKNHYILPKTLHKTLQEDLVSYFSNLYRAYKKPILTKNNRNSLLIPFFKESFNNSFFVIVRRNPIAVIRSTIKASKDFFGKEGLLWGLYPDEKFDTNNYENLIESASVQFLLLDKILDKQIAQLNKNSYLEIDYDDFCKNPKQFQEKLQSKLVGKDEFSIKKIRSFDEDFSTSERLSNQELEDRISFYIDKWKNKI